MVTIYDIAKRAGVSPSTVSKALNGRRDVNDVTRTHVLAMASQMGYTPNVHARGLKMKKSWLIGVVYTDGGISLPLDHPLFLPLLDSFKTEIESQGYELLFFSDQSPLIGQNMLAHCVSRQVDGVLLLNIDKIDPVAVRSVSESIPMVSCNVVIDGVPSVVTDNYGGAKQAVQFLIQQGHKRIAHVGGPKQHFVRAAYERCMGYRDALSDANIPYDTLLVREAANWSPEAGAEATRLLLQSNPQGCTGIFYGSDSLMLGGISVLAEMGIEVGKDCSVIGFDGALWTKYMTIGYSTMMQQASVLGSKSAQLLMENIEGNLNNEIVRVPAILVSRGSTPCLQAPKENR